MSRMAEQQLYIHGGYTSATSGRTFETINPANGNVLATVQAAGREDVDRAVKSAQQGQKIWAAMTAMERSPIRKSNPLFGNLNRRYRYRCGRAGVLCRADPGAGRQPDPVA